ncbi:MAG: hypothetical protein U0793_33785 [Gemmataceae bacterium]
MFVLVLFLPAAQDVCRNCASLAIQSDRSLISALKKAVREQARIEEIENGLGVKAGLISTRPGDEYSLRRLTLTPDQDQVGSLPVLKEASGVAIWPRPFSATSRNGRIIGVAFDKDGRVVVFFAISWL